MAQKRKRRAAHVAGSPSAKANSRTEAARIRALDVLNRMRNGASFSAALKQAKTTARSVRAQVASALLQPKPGGRIHAAKGDSFSARVFVVTPLGLAPVKVRGSKQRTLAGQHLAAVKSFLAGKDPASSLQQFEGASLGGHPLITDVDLLSALAQADNLRGDELYVALGGMGA